MRIGTRKPGRPSTGRRDRKQKVTGLVVVKYPATNDPAEIKQYKRALRRSPRLIVVLPPETADPATHAAYERACTVLYRRRNWANVLRSRSWVESGDPLAQATVLNACAWHSFGDKWSRREAWNDKMEIPRWLACAIWRTLAGIGTGQMARRPGRNARWLSQWRQDSLDYMRWNTVEQLKRKVKRIVLFDEAARELDNSPWAGSAHTIRHAYERVQRRMKAEPERYFQASWGAFVRYPKVMPLTLHPALYAADPETRVVSGT